VGYWEFLRWLVTAGMGQEARDDLVHAGWSLADADEWWQIISNPSAGTTVQVRLAMQSGPD
jgi:hypothetical protein